MEFYRNFAESAGCADRCRWINRFLDPIETANLLCASDLIRTDLFAQLCLFERRAGRYRQLLFALPDIQRVENNRGAGQAPITLGIWVEPDGPEAIRAGLAALAQEWRVARLGILQPGKLLGQERRAGPPSDAGGILRCAKPARVLKAVAFS